ncbi:MAG: hypothetical protein V7641_854 [Blastocatellia bacterium]
MRLKRFLAISGILTLAFGSGGRLTSYPQQRVSQDREVAGAIDDLWSANDEERQAAKEKLIQLGQASVQPLIDLLQDIITNPTARYLRGKEMEASELDERLRSLPKESRREAVRLVNQLGELVVNWRLKSDICELLGRLRAEAAIPVLMKMMETEDSIGSEERMNPAMKALVRIGPVIFPRIIEAIETAESRAAATKFGFDHTPSEFFIRAETVKIQARAAMILGAMGDTRALPILEELLNKNRDEELLRYVKEAIRQIWKSN